ncbi:MAG TPA: ribosome small subunit-dependent GTPase A [Candidatus Angelobacter sp.]|nr:ribosome small subunit-dependent GTPase A [Candidatus Angelobacter sp.]
MLLENFGWNDFFSQQLSGELEYLRVGRVVSANREHFLLWTQEGELQAGLSGRLRRAASEPPRQEPSSSGQLWHECTHEDGSEWPCVGDWVVLRGDTPSIVRVLKRRTRLSRKQPGKAALEQVLAANIDVLFIVSGLDRDYNPRRIERYLTLAGESGARAVVLLNKADLADELGLDLPRIVAETQQLCGGTSAAVFPVSAVSPPSQNNEDDQASHAGKDAEDGLSALRNYLSQSLSAGETAALIGSSGVGKSTILNRLLGEERQRTQTVRSFDHRGRHTTTGRELFLMPEGWLLMDLPGLRELQLWASTETLDSGFDDIQELAVSCRFRDCSHTTEPGCAVQGSEIAPGRIANYRKMRREIAYLDRKSDARAAQEERRRWKAIEKSVRSHPKREP